MPADVLTSRPSLPPVARAPGVIRPRTAGEVLDDAWRLALANAPLLLALSGLFNVPAAVALLLLLTLPAPAGIVPRLVLPAVAAALLPLTGLGSGACQEAFRLQAEGKPVGLGVCLWGALGRGLDHVAARAAVLGATLLGLGVLVMPGLAVWAGAAGVHAILAERRARLFDALGLCAREAPRQAGKAVVVTLCRLPILALAVLNLLAVVEAGLWVAGNLGGLDTSLLSLLLSLSNPACVAAFVLLAWLLLAPFAEACNFLLYVDARARYEGLDLWYRVRQVFPVVGRGRAVAVLLALGVALLLAAPAAAAPPPADRLAVVHEVREKVDAIRQEVERAQPYPGGNRWLPALRDLAGRLDPAGGTNRGPYRWFYAGLEGFGARDQQGAVEVLAELGRRLETAEQSLALAQEGPEEGGRPALSKEQIKSLVPKASDGGAEEDGQPHKADAQEAKHEPRRPVVRRDDDDEEGGHQPVRRGPGVVPAQTTAGLGSLGWMLVGGMLLAIVVVACLLFFQRQPQAAPAAAKTESGTKAPSLEDVLRQPQAQTAASLWRQAEQLAAAGNHLEAVRLLYAAVLATLHRAGLIRYEATRTNGEYAGQLRANPQTPGEVHEPFGRLTGLFELKWYGERACRPEEYRDCRGLAERIRGLV